MPTDLTDVSQTADKLRIAAELASLVQHQINNPLAVVLGNIQFLLLKPDKLDPALAERLKVVEKAALRIAEVNSKLSDIPRSVVADSI